MAMLSLTAKARALAEEERKAANDFLQQPGKSLQYDSLALHKRKASAYVTICAAILATESDFPTEYAQLVPIACEYWENRAKAIASSQHDAVESAAAWKAARDAHELFQQLQAAIELPILL